MHIEGRYILAAVIEPPDPALDPKPGKVNALASLTGIKGRMGQ
jgi:hypothetical protein